MTVPLSVEERGPFQAPAGGPPFYVRKTVLDTRRRTECAAEPYIDTRTGEGENCRRHREWSCREVFEEQIVVELIEAVKKSSWAWYVGGALLVIGLAATGLGLVALIGLALDSAFVVGVSAATVWSAVGAGAAGVTGGVVLIRLDQDSYKPGSVLEKRGPEWHELSASATANKIENGPCPEYH